MFKIFFRLPNPGMFKNIKLQNGLVLDRLIQNMMLKQFLRMKIQIK